MSYLNWVLSCFLPSAVFIRAMTASVAACMAGSQLGPVVAKESLTTPK